MRGQDLQVGQVSAQILAGWEDAPIESIRAGDTIWCGPADNYFSSFDVVYTVFVNGETVNILSFRHQDTWHNISVGTTVKVSRYDPHADKILTTVPLGKDNKKKGSNSVDDPDITTSGWLSEVASTVQTDVTKIALGALKVIGFLALSPFLLAWKGAVWLGTFLANPIRTARIIEGAIACGVVAYLYFKLNISITLSAGLILVLLVYLIVLAFTIFFLVDVVRMMKKSRGR